MADNDELKTTRLSDSSDGATIDNAFANIEAALRKIFKIPADTAMSEAMQIAAGGNVTMTGAMTLEGAPSTDLMAATRRYVQSGSGGLGTVMCAAGLTSTGSYNTDSYIEWDQADIEVGGEVWSSGNPTRLTIPSSGTYLVGACAAVAPSGSNTHPWLVLVVNRTTTHTKMVNPVATPDGVYKGISFSQLFQFTAGDYLELYIFTISIAFSLSSESRFWIMKVSE